MNCLDRKVFLKLFSLLTPLNNMKPWDTHISQTSGCRWAHERTLQALDIWGLGRAESGRKKEQVGRLPSCCWWAPFNFITPTPSLLWFLYLKTLVFQTHKGFLPKLPDRWLCMGRDGRVGRRREQRESYVLKKKTWSLQSRGKKRYLIWQ